MNKLWKTHPEAARERRGMEEEGAVGWKSNNGNNRGERGRFDYNQAATTKGNTIQFRVHRSRGNTQQQQPPGDGLSGFEGK